MTVRFALFPYLLTFTTLCAQTSEGPLKITHLTGDFYVYTTYNYYKGDRIPAIVADGESVEAKKVKSN